MTNPDQWRSQPEIAGDQNFWF